MKISYGPPGHQGVTKLMAVGADDYSGGLDQAVSKGGLVAVGVWGLGVLLGSQTLKHWGFGAGLALYGARLVAGRLGQQKVTVTAPAATGCLTCII